MNQQDRLDRLCVVLADLKKGCPVVVGFNPALLQDNLRLAQRVVDGASRGVVASEFKVTPSHVTKIKGRLAALRLVQIKLTDGISHIPMPRIFATGFSSAANYANRHFCTHLDLPSWRLEDEFGNSRPVTRIR